MRIIAGTAALGPLEPGPDLVVEDDFIYGEPVGPVVSTDLSITKTATPDPVIAGELVTYTIEVKNNGSIAAQNVQVSDVLPAGTTLQSASATAPFGISVSGNSFIATAASLASGASATFIVTAMVNPTTTGTINNTATVSSATADPNTGNNSATATTSVCANINVTIPDAMAIPSGVDPNTVYPGYALASSITLTAQVSGGTMPYNFTWSNGAHTQSITVSPTTTTTYTVTVTDAHGCPVGGATASKTVWVVDVSGGHNQDKVMICHKPGKLNHTLTIGADGVADHLAHGDQLGACPMASTTLQKPGSVEEMMIPAQFSLQSRPNPFNSLTRIQYTVPVEANVIIKVFDMLGREVGVLYNGNQPAGTHFVDYNATKLSKGMYYARMLATVNGKQYVQIQ
ncbi:MAG TPA: T9SS type A sorting domain-containing protein, partial [Flavisolibacter sp.]|nr:T9SS type A sorting domain-containing protein [Flavisolibacter sp.]